MHSSILAPLVALVLWSFVMWAWLYVGLRIAHSLVQATVNLIMLRFAIFMAASFVLLVISVRAALIVFRGG